jgi:molybdopterin molybdotransferase
VADLLSIDEAQRLILERATALPAEPVPIEQAAGRILAEAAVSTVDLPPFPSSAMDGFALRAADTPAKLQIVGRVAAGVPFEGVVEPGSAVGIATGGEVPPGADAVAPIEVVAESDNKVEVPSTEVGANVRPRGGDLRLGDIVGDVGDRLTPARLGALAAAGVAEVRCARRPRAAVVPTGTELRKPGEELRAGEVYEANGLILERHDAVGDDEAQHRAALEQALGSDVVVTSGGVSVGPHDLVRQVEAELGVEEIFWRVAVKPGKPISFGVRGETLVFGLPGNPVSAFVGFELFVKPAVLALQGIPDPLPRFEPARLASGRRRNPNRDELVRARRTLDGDGVVLQPLGGQESHMIASAAAADALILVPRGDGELEAGASVRYLPI